MDDPAAAAAATSVASLESQGGRGFLGKWRHHRNHDYVLLIEKMPLWSVILLFLLGGALCSLFIVISAIFSPMPHVLSTITHNGTTTTVTTTTPYISPASSSDAVVVSTYYNNNNNYSALFGGYGPVVFSTAGAPDKSSSSSIYLDALNQQLTMRLVLYRRNSAAVSLYKGNVAYRVLVTVKSEQDGSSSSNKVLYDSGGGDGDKVHYRPMVCMQQQQQQQDGSGSSSSIGSSRCGGMDIAYLDHIPPLVPASKGGVDIEVWLYNVGVLYEGDGVVDGEGDSVMDGGVVSLELEYISAPFTQWELGWRYAWLIASGVCVVGMVVYVLCRQSVKRWCTEQWAIVVLLGLLLVYDNPLYVLGFIPTTTEDGVETGDGSAQWILGLMNTVFTVTYVCYLLYVAMVMSHSTYTTPRQRKLLSFFLPKVLIVSALWLCVTVVVAYTRIKEWYDPAFRLYEDLVGTGGTTGSQFSSLVILSLLSVLVVLAYLFTVMFYLVRGAGYCVTRKLPTTHTPKYIAVLCFTLLLMVASVVDVFLYLFVYYNNGAQLLSYFAIYNVFSILLAVLYMPSFTRIAVGARGGRKTLMMATDDTAATGAGAGVDGDAVAVVGSYDVDDVHHILEEDEFTSNHDEFD